MLQKKERKKVRKPAKLKRYRGGFADTYMTKEKWLQTLKALNPHVVWNGRALPFNLIDVNDRKEFIGALRSVPREYFHRGPVPPNVRVEWSQIVIPVGDDMIAAFISPELEFNPSLLSEADSPLISTCDEFIEFCKLRKLYSSPEESHDTTGKRSNKKCYNELVSKLHPDKGGTNEGMQNLNNCNLRLSEPSSFWKSFRA